MSNLIKHRDRFIIFLVEKTKPVYGKFFKQKVIPWKTNLKRLAKYPQKSLGNDLYQFLKREKLELMPKFEDHDIMHVLFGYKTTVLGELKMQFFLLGNGKKSLYCLISALIGCIMVPEYWSSYWKEFNAGKNSRNFSKWNFQFLLNEPTILLRKFVYKEEFAKEAPFCL